MDFLNRATEQLRGYVESMTPGTRILAGLLLAVVVLSTGFLFHHESQGPDEFLFGGDFLPDSQLNRIEAAIAQAGLTGHRREGHRLRVPAGQQAAYLAAIADADALPPNFNTILEAALDGGNPLETREAARERLKITKQQTLSEIVRAMHWVEDAVVLYDEQEPYGLSHTKQVIGSVNVKPKQGESLDARRIHMLQTFVAHAVVGLKPEDVAVTNLGEDGPYGSDESVYSDAFNDEYYKTQIAYEQYKRQSILNALSDIPGVRVEVNVQLDTSVKDTVPGAKSDPAAVQDRDRGKSHTSRPSTPGNARHGTFAQGPGQPTGKHDLNLPTQDEASAQTAIADRGVERESPTNTRTRFTPKEVRATITIPRSYVEKIWRQRYVDDHRVPTEKDLRDVQQAIVAKVESIVEPLLPRIATGNDRGKPVCVVVLDSVTTPSTTEPPSANEALAWASRNRSTLAMLAVVVFGLLGLRSLVAASPTRTGTNREDLLRPVGAAQEDVHLADAELTKTPGFPRPAQTEATSPKDDLNQIVHQHPDAAAAILKSWIEKAG